MGQGSHIGNQCSPGCPFLHPTGPADVRPICLVRLIESHAPLLWFAFAIFSIFLLPEKNLSQSLGDGLFLEVVLSFRERLETRFVFEQKICLQTLLPPLSTPIKVILQIEIEVFSIYFIVACWIRKSSNFHRRHKTKTEWVFLRDSFSQSFSPIYLK